MAAPVVAVAMAAQAATVMVARAAMVMAQQAEAVVALAEVPAALVTIVVVVRARELPLPRSPQVLPALELVGREVAT